MIFFSSFKKNFLIGGKLLYNLLLVSAVEKCKSAIMTHISLLKVVIFGMLVMNSSVLDGQNNVRKLKTVIFK